MTIFAAYRAARIFFIINKFSFDDKKGILKPLLRFLCGLFLCFQAVRSVALPLTLFLGVFLCQARGMGDNPVFLGGDPACLDAGKEMTAPPAADCPCKQAKDKALDVLRKIKEVCSQRGEQQEGDAGNDLDDSRGHLVILLVGLWLGALVGYFAGAVYQTFSPIDCKPETPKSNNANQPRKEG